MLAIYIQTRRGVVVARPTRADPLIVRPPMKRRIRGVWGARPTRADPLVRSLAHQVWRRPRAQRVRRPTESPVGHSSKGARRGINSYRQRRVDSPLHQRARDSPRTPTRP